MKHIKSIFIFLFIFGVTSIYPESQYKIVKDHMGKTVKIPTKPKRIIALNPSIMEGLYELGMEPIAKVDEYKIREIGKKLPSVGSQTNINIESIYKLNPDIIIANSRNHGNIQNLLRETGAAVYMYNPSKLGKQPFYDIPLFLGELFGHEKQAEEYVKNLNIISSNYKEKISKNKNIESGIIIENIENIRVYQKATGYGTIMESLGIDNIVPDDMLGSSKEAAVNFSLESIYKLNPDLILITAPVNKPEINQKIIETIKNDSQWKNLKAVKNNNVKVLPFKLHPGRGKKEDLIKMMAESILSD